MRKWSGRGQLKPVPWTTWTLPQQQVEDEPLVVVDGMHLGVQPREGVQRAARSDARDSRDLVQLPPGAVTLLVQPAAGCGQLADGLASAERGLDGVLGGALGHSRMEASMVRPAR